MSYADPAALITKRLPVADLSAGAITAKRLRLPSGLRLPPGAPLSHEALRELVASGTDEITVFDGESLRSAPSQAEAVRARALVIIATMHANLRTKPPARRAVDPLVGERAQEALEVAIGTAAWFTPISDALMRHGALSGSFLEAGLEAALLAAITGAHLGWEDDVLSELALAALVADIGMLMLPNVIRRKPGVLSRLERRSVERHPVVGEGVFAPARRAFPLVPLVVRQHHECVDGSGYPDALFGHHVRPEAQAVNLAYRFLAAITPRNYRQAIPPHEAMELVQTLADRLADRRIVMAFADAVALYPVDSMVRLSDGRMGRVVNTRSGNRPMVEARFGADGELCEPHFIDLADNFTLFVEACC